MKDGRIIQIGTPEDIVTNPADDYVADFVASISRLKFVHAASLMQNPEAYIAEFARWRRTPRKSARMPT
ncbi:hypothetical protein [Aliamphritea spongicola]|nr:hypothetical protein [Aliamphritea spongicola]